jgi:hypothetical protein
MRPAGACAPSADAIRTFAVPHREWDRRIVRRSLARDHGVAGRLREVDGSHGPQQTTNLVSCARSSSHFAAGFCDQQATENKQIVFRI